MRVRVSRGWKITRFVGHLFIRNIDLLMVPNCHADQTFAITIDFDDKEGVTPDPILSIQSAMLYSNSDGERRIRVQTWSAPTTQNINEIYMSIDVQATIALLSSVTLDHSMKTTLQEGRTKLHQQCTHFVQQGNVLGSSCEPLQFLPLYIMGMLKSTAFRSTNDVSADMRSYVWLRMETLNVAQVAAAYCPRLIAVHNMAEHEGVMGDNGSITLPPTLNLTSEVMSQDGVYMLDDGECIHMWIGKAVNAHFLESLFGVPSIEQVDPGVSEEYLQQQANPLAIKINNIVQQIRAERLVPFLQLHIIRNGDPKESKFFAGLIEDRTLGLQTTFAEFLQRMGHRPH